MGDAYTLTAARLGDMIKMEKQLKEEKEDEAEDFLEMMDRSWRNMESHDLGGGASGGVGRGAEAEDRRPAVGGGGRGDAVCAAEYEGAGG